MVISWVGVSKIVVLVIGVAIPETKQAFHGPKRQENIHVDRFLNLLKMKRVFRFKQCCQGNGTRTIFFGTLVLGFDIFDGIRVKIRDGALVELATGISVVFVEERIAD